MVLKGQISSPLLVAFRPLFRLNRFGQPGIPFETVRATRERLRYRASAASGPIRGDKTRVRTTFALPPLRIKREAAFQGELTLRLAFCHVNQVGLATSAPLSQATEQLVKEKQLLTEIRRRVASLCLRERQVLSQVTAGAADKHIDANSGISESTVTVHHSRVMDNMQTESLAKLVKRSVALRCESKRRR